MIDLKDVKNIEEGAESELEYYTSLQKAINSGSAWSLQGSYGRTMMEAIETGKCVLGRNPAKDYYGNRIPSRLEVKRGTKGSVKFVEERSGKTWARKMARIKD